MTIIKKLAIAGSVAGLALASTPALAAAYVAPSVNGTATVRLYDAITLDKVSDIDFGVVIRDSTYAGGTSVSMNAAGATNCASVSGVSCTGSPTAGTFTIKGDSGSDMSVSLSSADWSNRRMRTAHSMMSPPDPNASLPPGNRTIASQPR